MALLTGLQAAIARHGAPGFVGTVIPRVTLLRSDAGGAMSASVRGICLLLVAQGRARLSLGGTPVELAAPRYVVAPAQTQVAGEILQAGAARPFLGVALCMDPAILSTLLLDMGEQLHDPATPIAVVAGVPGPELLDPLLRLIRLLDSPADIRMLAPLFERELLYRLLLGEQGPVLRQFALSNGRLARVGIVINQIRVGYAQPMQVGLLASRVGMSLSSLHRHFLAATGMSPLQYQKRLRLLEARRRLAAHPSSAASVAYAVGYESPSQFSREYRKMFGVTPSRDAVEMRDNALRPDLAS